MRIFFFSIIIAVLFSLPCFSQKGNTTVGIQLKPIFPFAFLGTGKITNDVDGVHFETLLTSGFSGGLVIRHNFNDLLAFETGINYVKRKYSLTITDGDFTDKSYFRVISYEIPAVFMVYAQLGEKIYMNGSLGPSLDMFVSSIQTYDDYFNHIAFRNHIFQPALSANVGWEYRTEKSGNIYIGASFHKPFSFIYLSEVVYDGNNKNAQVINELSGTYLTIDLRYFFPETNTKKRDE
jgi:hypothetical protein